MGNLKSWKDLELIPTKCYNKLKLSSGHADEELSQKKKADPFGPVQEVPQAQMQRKTTHDKVWFCALIVSPGEPARTTSGSSAVLGGAVGGDRPEVPAR